MSFSDQNNLRPQFYHGTLQTGDGLKGGGRPPSAPTRPPFASML